MVKFYLKTNSKSSPTKTKNKILNFSHIYLGTYQNQIQQISNDISQKDFQVRDYKCNCPQTTSHRVRVQLSELRASSSWKTWQLKHMETFLCRVVLLQEEELDEATLPRRNAQSKSQTRKSSQVVDSLLLVSMPVPGTGNPVSGTFYYLSKLQEHQQLLGQVNQRKNLLMGIRQGEQFLSLWIIRLSGDNWPLYSQCQCPKSHLLVVTFAHQIDSHTLHIAIPPVCLPLPWETSLSTRYPHQIGSFSAKVFYHEITIQSLFSIAIWCHF